MATDGQPERGVELWSGLRISAFVALILITIVASVYPFGSVPHSGSDKLAHFLMYCALAISGMFAFRGARNRMWVTAGLILMGGALELTQTWIPSRDGDWVDAAANTGGVFAGALVCAAAAWGRRSERAGRDSRTRD